MSEDMEHLDVVQDAELLYESIRAMKQLSQQDASVSAMHAMLGHLAVAGHLLPEVLTELAERLKTSSAYLEIAEQSPEATVRIEECQRLMGEAADLAFRAGTVLGQAQKALEDLA